MKCSLCKQKQKRQNLSWAPWLGPLVWLCSCCRPQVEAAFAAPLDPSLSVLDREAELPYRGGWDSRHCPA